MNETKKPLEFEEFVKNTTNIPVGVWEKSIWEAARQGMIPADRAVEIPEVWPEGATAWEAGFVNGPGWLNHEPVLHIERPAPIWCPKVGEAVFVHYNPTQVGRVEKVKEGEAPFVVLVEGKLNDIYTVGMLKPFSESAIGKEWRAI